MTYPFAGEIKMNKFIKDGQEVIEWEQVDMSLHSAGSLGIGAQPTGNICFFGTHSDNYTEVLRLSKDGIWANPDIPADEAAKLVLAAIDQNIKVLVDKAVTDERNSWPAEMEAMERQVNILTDALHQERERMKWDVHSCGPTCKRYACVAMREAVAAIEGLERSSIWITREEAIAAIRARSNT